MNISIITVTYNQLNDFVEFFKSIFTNTNYNYELIVVDNNSTDGTKEYLTKLAQSSDKVKVILLDDNYGEGRGYRIGMQLANYEYIVKCDPDILVPPNWDVSLISYYESLPLIIKEKTGTVSAQQQLILGWGTRRIFIDNVEIIECETILGALFLIPKRTILICGYWPEEFFYGNCEPMYAYKMQSYGLKSLIHPTLKIIHKCRFQTKKREDNLNTFYNEGHKFIKAYREFWESKGKSFFRKLLP